MEIQKFSAIFFSSIIFVGCICAQAIKPTGKPTDNTTQKILDLQKQLTNLNFRIWQLENNEKSISFDPSAANGFLRLRTNNGEFLISLKNVEPYLDGVRLTINIGNLYSASFNGFKIHAEWGPRLAKEDTDWPAWINSLKKNDFTFTNTLRAGAWNNITFVLAPAKTDTFGYINLSMETDVISLQTPIP